MASSEHSHQKTGRLAAPARSPRRLRAVTPVGRLQDGLVVLAGLGCRLANREVEFGEFERRGELGQAIRLDNHAARLQLLVAQGFFGAEDRRYATVGGREQGSPVIAIAGCEQSG